MGKCKLQNSESHVTTVLRSRVRFEWQEGLPAVSAKWLAAKFFASKNSTASRLKTQSSFLYLPAMCQLDFWTWINKVFMFFGDKVRHLDLTKNDMAALNNECLAKIWNPGNILQTHNCKLRFGVSHEKLDLYSDTSTPSEAFKVLGWHPLLGLTLAPCIENFIITGGWGWGYSEKLWIVVWFTNGKSSKVKSVILIHVLLIFSESGPYVEISLWT